MFFQNQENIKKLIDVSKAAGHAIMDIYNTNFEVQSKKDETPITKADLISNKIICESLGKINPNIPILSEESSNISYSERSKWNDYWLVDPLDGTKEFIKKNDEFTTNIALIRNNAPVFGIIHIPATNQTYWGSVTGGSYYLEGDTYSERVKISVSHSQSNLRIVCSRSHPTGELEELLAKLDNYELVRTGSSIKFCLIANGNADCYPRLGPTSEWDTAAGEIIARSAGANIVSFDDKPLKYNLRNSYLNPHFLVSNSLQTKQKILEKI